MSPRQLRLAAALQLPPGIPVFPPPGPLARLTGTGSLPASDCQFQRQRLVSHSTTSSDSDGLRVAIPSHRDLEF